MAKLAGFRNILVHEYFGMDTKQVYQVLQDDGKTIEALRKDVEGKPFRPLYTPRKLLMKARYI